jgi:hypothetical protein
MLEHGMYLDFLLQRPTIRRGIAEKGDDLDRCNSVSRMGRIVAAKDSVKREEGSLQSARQELKQSTTSRLSQLYTLPACTHLLKPPPPMCCLMDQPRTFG